MKISPWFWAAFIFGLVVAAAERKPEPNTVLEKDPRAPVKGGSREHLSLKNEIQHSIAKGLDWLNAQQKPSGAWLNEETPAVTALVLLAFEGDPNRKSSAPRPEFLERGYRFLVESAHPDGSIYRKGLQNYNTAVCLTALVAANDPRFDPIIRRAHDYLVGAQNDFGEKGKSDPVMAGGFGYGPGQERSDLSNTMLALEAMYYSEKYLGRENSSEIKKLNWPAAIDFIERCQNLPPSNSQPWASEDAQNRGGFVYYPGKSMAGEMKLASGRTALRSYGSMSYAGLLSYIYARLEKSDPRVEAVVDWLQKNYTLEENPGMGSAGLYYYFHTMSKALTVYGADRLKTPASPSVDWREDVAKRLINLQNPAGFWANENGRWWEKDPPLVTAYAIISLAQIERAW